METPFISIITPSFNRSAMIAEAVRSVLAQGYPDFEHIIVDGGSTDATLEVLGRFPHLLVISEPDQGMYDAINKGLKLAHGAIIAWLNTDDLYPPGTFQVVAQAFVDHPEASAISGGTQVFESTTAGLQIRKTEQPVKAEGFWKRIIVNPAPNGWFFRRELFDRLGGFDSSFRLVADREFLIRLAIAGIRPLPVERVLYTYLMHSGSATFQSEDSRHPVYGPRRMEVNQEDLRMLAGFLDGPNLPPEARRVMLRAHAEYAYRLVATAFYHHRWDALRQGLKAGFRRNPLFPLAMARFALRRLFRGTGSG